MESWWYSNRRIFCISLMFMAMVTGGILWGDYHGRAAVMVEVCVGSKIGDGFVGLYDLDGDQIQLGNATWEAVDDAPADVIEAVESGWESSGSVVRRLVEA